MIKRNVKTIVALFMVFILAAAMVVYFSATGTTKSAAKKVKKATGGSVRPKIK